MGLVMRKVIMVSVILANSLLNAYAAESEPKYVELQTRFQLFNTVYTVNDDFSVTAVSEIQIQALTDDAAKALKQQGFSYSTSIEDVEILESYTLKSNGEKIPVPEDNYQLRINKGNKDNQAIFSDRTKVSIVFPSLEENDAIYLAISNFCSDLCNIIFV